MNKKIIDKIKEDIADWRGISILKETPKLPGEGFESGWRLGINRVCNTIKKIIEKESHDEHK